MNKRVTDLEIRFTHQERAIQELSDIVFQQQKTMEDLQLELRQIREQLQSVAPSMVDGADEEEPPPHY